MKNLIIILSIVIITVGCSNINQPKTIAIQPFKGFPKELTNTIKLAIENYYNFNTIVYPDIKIPKEFYTAIKTPRYRADSIFVF